MPKNNAFSHYNIYSINLCDTLAMPQLKRNEGEGYYITLWWKEIGLGQFFIEPGEAFTTENYITQLIEAIKPAINFYAKKAALQQATWEEWVRANCVEAWHLFMEQVLHAYADIDIPHSVPVSVIICTRNRAESLQKCLISISALACQPEEILVVDNCPSDTSTEDIVKTFNNTTYVKEPRPGLDIARNTGVIKARLPVVAYLDDDILVHPLCIYHTWQTFNNPEVAAMTGLVIAASLQTEAQMIFEKHWSFNRGYTDAFYDSSFFEKNLSAGPPVWEIGAGANMAFRKSIFESTGYFNEFLDAGAAGCNGDSEMWFRILAKGYNIHYNPRAIVYHEHRNSLAALKSQIFYYMRGFATAALVQQKMYPQSGYIKNKLAKFPGYYTRMLIKEFPNYDSRHRTIREEVAGIIAGIFFYYKHRKHIAKPISQLYAEGD